MQKLVTKKTDFIIQDKKIPIRLACIKPDGVPLVTSLWYELVDGKIYCATQKNAKLVSFLKKNPSCGFEIAGDNPPYMGLRGEGIVKILENKGTEILDRLMNKYLGSKESTLSKFLKVNSKSEVAIEIIPQKIFIYDYSERMRGS